ncbi:UDP-N-acetylmuramyl-tripeptide synthetase family protein, partial [Chlamydia psittaci 08-2626_L3]
MKKDLRLKNEFKRTPP